MKKIEIRTSKFFSTSMTKFVKSVIEKVIGERLYLIPSRVLNNTKTHVFVRPVGFTLTQTQMNSISSKINGQFYTTINILFK